MWSNRKGGIDRTLRAVLIILIAPLVVVSVVAFVAHVGWRLGLW